MNHKLTTFLLCAALGAPVTPLRAAPVSAAEDRERIVQVVEDVRNAIIKKDRSRYLQLFFGGAIPFIGVTTDQSLQWENANKSSKTADSEKLYTTSNPKKFIDSVLRNPVRVDQTVDNLHIETDGDIAQAWFDYSFMEESYRAYSGRQSWNLVRSKEGWKITSVIWSMELNPAPPPNPKGR